MESASVAHSPDQWPPRVGLAIVRVGRHFAVNEVVLAGKGDLFLLSSHTLEGLNLAVGCCKKELVAAGTLPAVRSMSHGRSAAL